MSAVLLPCSPRTTVRQTLSKVLRQSNHRLSVPLRKQCLGRHRIALATSMIGAFMVFRASGSDRLKYAAQPRHDRTSRLGARAATLDAPVPSSDEAVEAFDNSIAVADEPEAPPRQCIEKLGTVLLICLRP